MRGINEVEVDRVTKSKIEVGDRRERAAERGRGQDPNNAPGTSQGMIQSAGRPPIFWAGLRSIAV
jgi:hypothetical protein